MFPVSVEAICNEFEALWPFPPMLNGSYPWLDNAILLPLGLKHKKLLLLISVQSLFLVYKLPILFILLEEIGELDELDLDELELDELELDELDCAAAFGS